MLVHLSGEEVRAAIIKAAKAKSGQRHAEKILAALFVPAAGQVNPLKCSGVVQLVKEVKVVRAAA
jgi:hypothetical protein